MGIVDLSDLKPDRSARIAHRDECFIIHVRNQIGITVIDVYDRFVNGPDWEAIKAADRRARDYGGLASVFGYYDFRGRMPDLDAVQEETLTFVGNLLDGYLIKGRIHE